MCSYLSLFFQEAAGKMLKCNQCTAEDLCFSLQVRTKAINCPSALLSACFLHRHGNTLPFQNDGSYMVASLTV